MEIPFKATLLKMNAPIVDLVKKIKNLGKEDPRRIVHSFKVALAITLVSMVYYLRPLYKGMGDAGIWAILTVVVVFEYTAGELIKIIHERKNMFSIPFHFSFHYF